MTDPRTFRRRAAALALFPAAAGLFGASVAWAGANDPLAAQTAAAAQVSADTRAILAQAAAAQAANDQHLADLSNQVVTTQARIAELQAVLDARNAAAAAVQAQIDAASSSTATSTRSATTAAKAAPTAKTATPASAAPAPAPAPTPAAAPAPAPAVAATTGASG